MAAEAQTSLLAYNLGKEGKGNHATSKAITEARCRVATKLNIYIHCICEKFTSMCSVYAFFCYRNIPMYANI